MARSRRNVSDHSKSLGIKWPLGLSRHKGRLSIPVIKTLEDNIKREILQFLELTPHEYLLRSTDLGPAADRVFESHGPRIWPTPGEDPLDTRFQWLALASEDTLGGY